MAPGQSIDEITLLRSRLAEVQAELAELKKSRIPFNSAFGIF